MCTPQERASARIARMQLLDFGDQKTAALLDWATEEPTAAPVATYGLDLSAGPVAISLVQMHGGRPVESAALGSDATADLVAALLEHINAMSEKLGAEAPDEFPILDRVLAWARERERVQAQTIHAEPVAQTGTPIIPESTDELVQVALVATGRDSADSAALACWQMDQMSAIAWGVAEYLVGTCPSAGPTPGIQQLRAAALAARPATSQPVPVALTDEQIDALMPDPDGTAEANKTPVEVAPGVEGYSCEHVDAWSVSLVRSAVRAALAASQSKPVALTDAEQRIKDLEEEVSSLEDEVDELKSVAWPDWANQVLKIVRKASGYDGYDDSDGVDIPGEVQELADEYSTTYDAVIALKKERDEARAALAAARPASLPDHVTPEQLSQVLQILRLKAQAFQSYSFLLINGGVRKVEDRSGAWISRHEVIQLLDETCTDGIEAALAASQPAPVADLIPEASAARKHAAACRSHAARLYNEPPSVGDAVEAGSRLQYAAQLLDILAGGINAMKAAEIEYLAAQVEAQAVPTQAARDVLAERQRQISVEGWTPDHDDEHRGGGMAVAAACYAVAGALADRPVSEVVSDLWPWTGWSWKWWKPGDKRRNLIKAGALILAEIERLDRAAAPTPSKGEA